MFFALVIEQEFGSSFCITLNISKKECELFFVRVAAKGSGSFQKFIATITTSLTSSIKATRQQLRMISKLTRPHPLRLNPWNQRTTWAPLPPITTPILNIIRVRRRKNLTLTTSTTNTTHQKLRVCCLSVCVSICCFFHSLILVLTLYHIFISNNERLPLFN
jgi:hypothetical protein